MNAAGGDARNSGSERRADLSGVERNSKMPSAAFVRPEAEHSLFRCGDLRRTATRWRTRVRRVVARTRKSPISKGAYGWANRRRNLTRQGTKQEEYASREKWDKGVLSFHYKTAADRFFHQVVRRVEIVVRAFISDSRVGAHERQHPPPP